MSTQTRIRKKMWVICKGNFGAIYKTLGDQDYMFKKGMRYECPYIDANVMSTRSMGDGRIYVAHSTYYYIISSRGARGKVVRYKWLREEQFHEFFKREIILRNTIVI